MHVVRSSFVAVGLLLASATAVASQNLNFQHYSIRQGLPQTQVRAIHQDTAGYLWVGTYGGLGRYNGREFDTFTTEEGLNSNTIEVITSTDDGTVWAGTTNGLCFLAPEAERFDCLKADSVRGTKVQALLPGEDNSLWIGTTQGLIHFGSDRNIRVARQDSTVFSADVTSLAQDGNGRLWVGSLRGLFVRNPDGSISSRTLPDDSGNRVRSLLHDGSRLWIGAVSGLYTLDDDGVREAAGLPRDWTLDDVNAIALDDDGNIWAATDQGVLRQREAGFDMLTTESGLRSSVNFTVFVDREGIVFLGHDDGLSKYTAGPFSSYTETNGLLHYFVRTINEDSEGHLWLGSRRGAQIVPYIDGDWRVDRSRTITDEDGLVDTRVYSIALVSPGEAWLATGNGVARWKEGAGVIDRIDRSDGLPDAATQALHLQDNGRLWIGTNHGVRVMHDDDILVPDNSALADAYVYRIREDARGRLWFASQEHGVFVMSGDGEFRQLRADDGLTRETVWDLAPDAEGGMWAGTNGDGLFHVAVDGSITQYTVADGMVDNFVWQVLVDDKGHVWGYTNRGITRFDGREFRNFGIEDGLLHLEGGATGAWQSHDGSLWFASADGLMRYEAGRERPSVKPPSVRIEQVSIGDQELDEGVELPYDAGNINVQYAALSFMHEDRITYSYRLIGSDDEWSQPVDYRPITYARLGGGDYVFEVRAKNPESEWSPEPARFRFSVAPPYWASPWFWSACIAGSILLMWLAFRFRVHQIEAHRRELQAEVSARTHELKEANDKLRAASVTDPLTGLHNRRFLSTQIHIDVAQTRRAYVGPQIYPNRDIVFMMIDLDNFKDINDNYGHGAGDRVLCQYAELLHDLMRESDYIVRWGGEEFLVVARQAEATQCNVIAERVVARVREALFTVDENGTTIDCTCSIGVSHFPFLREYPELLNWEQVIDIADKAVYMAKESGRDGWVAIQGIDKLDRVDAEWFVQQLRNDPSKLVATGHVRITGSFDDLPDEIPVSTPED